MEGNGFQSRIGPSILEVGGGLRNVFPADNFNRNVSTAWWDTDVLDDGNSNEEAKNTAKDLKAASFIVVDKDMYQVSLNPMIRKGWRIIGLIAYPPSFSAWVATRRPRR